jgi:hypothetical protein
MWWYLSQNIILSICIILVLQYIWDYCKTQYTTRKTKNIVDTQTQKYRDIIREIQQPVMTTPEQTEYISEEEKEQMIRDLTQFLRGGDSVPPYPPGI